MIAPPQAVNYAPKPIPTKFEGDALAEAGRLGCALTDGSMGRFIKVDEGKATSVPNVFACGDAVRAAGNVTLAVADGAMADQPPCSMT